MARDPNNEARWWATRKVDGEIEYLVSTTTWSEDYRFAKVFDAVPNTTAENKKINAKNTFIYYV